MANPEVAVTVGAPDPSWHPSTFTEACAFLNQITKASIQGSYTPYVKGSTTPAVGDQDKVWFRVDNAGRPIGLFSYYNGNWRRAASGLFGEVRAFVGNPAAFFDSTGRGIIGTDWDGWGLCNGLNGTVNLTDRFLVTAHLDNSSGIGMFSPTNGWTTGVLGTAQHTLGVSAHTLALSNIPRSPKDAILLDKFTADGNARSNSGLLLGHHSGTHDPDGSEAIIPADPGETTPDGFINIPPAIAVAYAQFIGYV